jgi:hypothetical protein
VPLPSFEIVFTYPGDVYVREWDIFLPWDRLPPLRPPRYAQVDDIDALSTAYHEKRVEYITEPQWPTALKEE